MRSETQTPEEAHRSAHVIDSHADMPQRFVDEDFELGKQTGQRWATHAL